MSNFNGVSANVALQVVFCNRVEKLKINFPFSRLILPDTPQMSPILN